VTEDGLRSSTSVNLVPESERFRVGEEVVAFLTYRFEAGVYSLSNGAFGAYRIHEGVVSPMTRDVAARRKDRPVDASLFFRDLQTLR
jgi:hypothetical protein